MASNIDSSPPTSEDPMDVCRAYLRHRGVTGTVIFAMLTGSQAYNLANSSSDKDYLGIYIVNTKGLLSIESDSLFPTQPLSSISDSGDFPDTTLYEAKQFLKLVVKGNPFAVEALFTRQNYVSTACFDRLRELRRAVLTRTLVEEFLSYVRGQISVHQRKGLKGKRVYHIIRILLELNRIIAGQEPWISFPEGDERDRLIYIRSVAQPGPEIVEAAQVMIDNILAQRPWNLPEVCDESLNEWLVTERLRLFDDPESGAT